MRHVNHCLSLLLVATFLWIGFAPSVAQERPAKKTRVDVLIYGGTAAGAIAAVAVAREGKSVMLIEPGRHLGGMVSGGLGATDTGNRGGIGGYSREFFSRVRDYYLKKYGPKSAQVKDCSDGFRFEPHVAEHILKEMIKEAKVPVVFNRRLHSVSMDGKRLTSIYCDAGRDLAGDGFAAQVFIDASYEGDLMAKARVSYTVGREGRDKYHESLAGVQKFSQFHQWPLKISPFDENKNLLPFIQPGAAGEPGAGDKKIQAYNFRLCMTQRDDLRLPWPKPDNYDAKRYELLARYLAKRPDVKVGQLMNPVKMPNGKTDTNNNGPFSTDHIGANWDYPEADYAKRKQIWRDHEDYSKGFLYFLANDPRVPPVLQKEMRSWGLSKGEFEDNHNWPHQLYIREARRLLGEYVMTQADITEGRTKPDSVGLGSYNTDSHHVQRVVGPDGFVLNEGDFQVRVQAYAIPYRSLVPKAGECENLLVPVCCSASHVAYGTIRMEPVYMILGQASGVAASIAVEEKTPVQKVPIDKLHAKLKSQKAVLSPEGLAKPLPTGTRLDPAKLKGIVVDDATAVKTGTWVSSASVGPYVGDGYVHDNNQDQGKASMRFTPKLEKAGRYEVRLFYTPHANRASNARVVIRSADGEKASRVNQKQGPKDGAGFLLGVFRFATGVRFDVEVRNDGADGYVIADAVQWILVR
jgi:hypothetical protein